MELTSKDDGPVGTSSDDGPLGTSSDDGPLERVAGTATGLRREVTTRDDGRRLTYYVAAQPDPQPRHRP